MPASAGMAAAISLLACAPPVAAPSLFVAAQPSGVEQWQRGLSQLDIDRPPKGVPDSRWQSFVAHAARFLAGPLAEPAAALGWTALDLFGADPERPFARIDRLGLLWLLNGGRLRALTSETATIATASGSILTYRRRPSEDCVPAWELR